MRIMLSLLAPAASCYLTAFGQQSLYNLYHPFGPAFRHHPLGLAPLLDHASLLNRASLLNHPSPLLRTPRFDFSHALQHLDMSHLDTEGLLLRAKMAHDTKAHAKRVAMRKANRLAQRQIHEDFLRELESSFKAHEQMFTQLRSHLEAAHVVAEEADAASFWHEADGNSGQLEATLRLPGSLISKPKAVLSDSRHLTMTMTTTVRGEEGHFEQTVALPFAVRGDPAAIELVHDEKGGTVTVKLAKPADEAPPEPVALPIVTAEPDKTKTKAVARADPKVEAATYSGLAAPTLCARTAYREAAISSRGCEVSRWRRKTSPWRNSSTSGLLTSWRPERPPTAWRRRRQERRPRRKRRRRWRRRRRGRRSRRWRRRRRGRRRRPRRRRRLPWSSRLLQLRLRMSTSEELRRAAASATKESVG